jgi:peptidoglycan/LPS O-acetylase OafA/YrhL
MIKQAEIDQKYLPSLDGLRALSISLVIVAHFGLDHIVPGGFGVTVFFFISGFIITRLLLAEYAANQNVLLGRFYARRFLRLAPALLTYIAVSTVFVWFVSNKFSMVELASALFYAANYYNIFTGYQEPGQYVILWSLAVEEHYYIVYPLLVAALFASQRRALVVLGSLVALVLIWRIYLVYGMHVYDTNHARIYMGTDTRIDSIIYGAILAIAMAVDRKGRLIALFSRPAILGIAISGLLATFLYRDPLFRETLRYSVQGIVLIPLICSLVFAPQLLIIRGFFELPWLVYVGKLSYSLYLYHWFGRIVADWATPKFGLPWIAVAASVAVIGALVSYHGIERRVIGLRRAFGSHAK